MTSCFVSEIPRQRAFIQQHGLANRGKRGAWHFPHGCEQTELCDVEIEMGEARVEEIRHGPAGAPGCVGKTIEIKKI
jgi:hypothetical protein